MKSEQNSRRGMRAMAVLAGGIAVAGVVATAAPASAATPHSATCAQPSHAWLATPGGSLGGGNTVNVGVSNNVYGTGVVVPGTAVNFYFQYPNGQVDAPLSTTKAGDNCVIAHQPNFYTMPSTPTTLRVSADYTAWETGQRTTVFLGTINVQ